MGSKALTPKQDRSRESFKRLLVAATEILEEKGLAGATIPRIAARAGLSPGSVYRRFPDKDALIQAVIVAVLESNDKGAEQFLSSETMQKMDLKTVAETIIKESVRGHRKHSNLLRITRQYVLSHPNARFRKKVHNLEVRSLRRFFAFFSERRKHIRHPDPETAIPLAFVVMGAALMELTDLNMCSEEWVSLLPKNDEELGNELTRVMLSYLGVDGKRRR
jgi:AcrR family transcriptional regulator